MDEVRITDIQHQPEEMNGLQVVTEERIDITITILSESRPETLLECSGLDICRIDWDQRCFSAMIKLTTFKQIRKYYLASLT